MVSVTDWVQHQVTRGVRVVVSQACWHSIHTLLVTALLAATAELHVLEMSFLAANVGPWPSLTQQPPWTSYHSPGAATAFAWGRQARRYGRWMACLRGLGMAKHDRPSLSNLRTDLTRYFYPADCHWALINLTFHSASVNSSLPFLSETLAESVGAKPIPQTLALFTSLSNVFMFVFRVPHGHLGNVTQALELVISKGEDATWTIERPRMKGNPISLGYWIGSPWLSFLTGPSMGSVL
ncbi:hypothetical protein BDV23DRAFT_168512 [Aspergillus alliaceus]|uniref:HMG-CoA reductase N-terminal domain-containing protein n=1 Tax=Petromyces alliaceus TaxID=209559 RepID=A0A5N7CNI7_PETAA|nr:hypothetical protein BDV23DRAFT_168512 [Aspergillus alliaceus]